MALEPLVDAASAAYVHAVARRLRVALGDRLIGAWVVGSAALGDFDPRRSDLDVQAIADVRPPRRELEALAARLSHAALPCPARGLELVVYPLATAQAGTGAPGFELNLNTGAAMVFRVDEQPGEIEGFWFAIDRSILREHGIPLHGPPAAEVFAPIPRATLDGLVAESMRWHRESATPTSADVLLNTARSQHFLDTGHWISKPDARQLLDGATPPA